MVSLGSLFGEPLFVSRGVIAFFLFASLGTLWSGLALPLAAEPWQLSPAQIGVFGIAGLAGALVMLALSWMAAGQANWSLWLVIVGVIVLDFAVHAAHVSNQALLTAGYAHQTSSAIGGYMIFYSHQARCELRALRPVCLGARPADGGGAALIRCGVVSRPGVRVHSAGHRTGGGRPD
ncbi:hypothetical protein [Mycolicibacterium sp. A43C]